MRIPPSRAPRLTTAPHLRSRVLGLFHGALHELRAPAHRRLPFLDGLRAIAVLLVINDHVASTFADHFGGNAYTRFPLTANGWIGVDLFFVLSGFFIGFQLWKELVRTGTISFPNFVWRRGLRIWPLYFFTFAVVFLLWPGDAATKQYGWSDLVFLTNYLNHGIVRGGWSLSTEEQFYLLSPALLLLFARRSLRWFRGALAALFVLEILVRIAIYIHLSGHLFVKDTAAFARLYYPFHTHADGLILGLLIANLSVDPATSKDRVRGLLARPGLCVLAGFLALVLLRTVQAETLGFAGLALFFGSLVWAGLRSRTTLLQSHIFYLISRLSFGMYLNHIYLVEPINQLIATAFRTAHLPSLLVSPVSFACVSACSAALAAVTFCLIEHPFLILRTAILARREVVPLIAH